MTSVYCISHKTDVNETSPLIQKAEKTRPKIYKVNEQLTTWQGTNTKTDMEESINKYNFILPCKGNYILNNIHRYLTQPAPKRVQFGLLQFCTDWYLK